jgi:non-homologous end joining protein Ku
VRQIEETRPTAQVIDLMEALRKSVGKGGDEKASGKKTTSRRKSTRRKPGRRKAA